MTSNKEYAIDEDKIVTRPNVHYMDSHKVPVKKGEADIPEEIMGTALARQSKENKQDLYFRVAMNRDVPEIIVRDTLMNLPDWEYQNYKRITLPEGKIKLKFGNPTAPKGKDLISVMVKGHKDHFTVSVLEKKSDKETEETQWQ